MSIHILSLIIMSHRVLINDQLKYRCRSQRRKASYCSSVLANLCFRKFFHTCNTRIYKKFSMLNHTHILYIYIKFISRCLAVWETAVEHEYLTGSSYIYIYKYIYYICLTTNEQKWANNGRKNWKKMKEHMCLFILAFAYTCACTATTYHTIFQYYI